MGRSVKEIEGDVHAEQRTIVELESEIERQTKDREVAAQKQEALAYLVHAKKDPKATKDLERAEETVAKADTKLKSLQIAARKAKERLEVLEAEKAEAFRAEKKVELEAEIAATIEDAKGIDMALATLFEQVGKHKSHEEKIVQLAGEAGYEHRESFYSRKFVLRRIGTQLEQRSYRTLVYRDVFKEQSVTNILRSFFEARMNRQAVDALDAEAHEAPEAEIEAGEEARG